MENIITCLDHGYVELLNIAGPIRRPEEAFDADDVDPAKVARTSFNSFEKGRSREDDLKLSSYLMQHLHTGPFEMVQVWLKLKVPMFLGEQILRHRTASFNKVSGRYTTMEEEWYIPETVGGKATNVKQGQEDNLSQETQESFKLILKDVCKESYRYYLVAIENGVAPEHARLLLHANHYTTLVMRQDLHNLMHFLALRLDSHAQIEAQIYARAIYSLLSQHLPESMRLFDAYRRKF